MLLILLVLLLFDDASTSASPSLLVCDASDVVVVSFVGSASAVDEGGWADNNT